MFISLSTWKPNFISNVRHAELTLLDLELTQKLSFLFNSNFIYLSFFLPATRHNFWATAQNLVLFQCGNLKLGRKKKKKKKFCRQNIDDFHNLKSTGTYFFSFSVGINTAASVTYRLLLFTFSEHAILFFLPLWNRASLWKYFLKHVLVILCLYLSVWSFSYEVVHP